MKTIALILAGGSGTRLWPLSRQLTPKQLLPLLSDKSLLQATSERILDLVPPEDQWIITGADYFFQVKSQLPEVNVLKEPCGKNTAPAIFWMANICREKYGEDTVMLVLPSDHLILKEKDFLEALRLGIAKAEEGNIVTFGIKPTHPETGYGYIRVEEEFRTTGDTPLPVAAFVEKPDSSRAQTFLDSGKYLWNSGMFAFHVGTLMAEGQLLCPDILEKYQFEEALSETAVEKAYQEVRSISIDYALMEHTDRAFVIPAEFGWSDVGSWKSLYEVSEKDEEENVIEGECVRLETRNSMIHGQEGKLIVTLGVEGMAIVDTEDALLVASMDHLHLMTAMIGQLKEAGHKTLKEGRTTRRPWGSYTVLLEGPGYKIKEITVLPGQKLSRQMHFHRNEHWIVVKGTARITNGEDEVYIYENQSTYISKTVVHRLENPGIIPLEIIEIQTGIYLEEDDIVRFDDVYGRLKKEGEGS